MNKNVVTPKITPKDAEEAKTLLARAANLLQTKGWCQGDSTNDKGQFCALGALHHKMSTRAFAPYDVAKVYLGSAITRNGFRQSHIVTWNDTKGRTKSQVLRVFRTAIQLATKDAAHV